MELTPPEKLTLFLGAFRYYLGRASYAVSEFTALLAKHWDDVDPYTKNLILKELKEELDKDTKQRDDPSFDGWCCLGHDCDRQSWLTLYNTINQWHQL